MKFASDISRLPFGRTDVLMGANDAPSPELSYGHGLKGASLHGFSNVGIFLMFAAKWERTIEKTRVGFGRTEVSIPPCSSSFRELHDGPSFSDIGAQ